MKEYIRRPLSIVASTILYLLLLFHLTQDTNEKLIAESLIPQSSIPQNQVMSKASPGSPVRLKIPAISVNAVVQHVGVTSKGEMDVPSNTFDVGWFDPGPPPGEQGNAVIAGHFNGENGEEGVFKNLEKLKKGDEIAVTDDQGKTISFAVREIRTYRPGYAEEVFSPNDNGTHLNLITCDGVWDEAKKSYSKRLVVFADISQ